MGSDSAVRSQYDVSKQGQASAPAAAAPVPGKAPLAEPFAAGPDGVARVAARAGETVADGGGYTFVVLADGTFKVVGAPPDHQSSIDAILTPTRHKDAWLVLARRLAAKPPAKAAEPAPTAAPPAAAAANAPDAPAADEPSLVQRALATIESDVADVRKRVTDAWSRALSLFGGGTTTEGPTASQPAPAPAAPAPATAVPRHPTPLDPSKIPIDMVFGMSHYHDAQQQTMDGTPLEIGRTRAEGDHGLANTEYTQDGTTAAQTAHLKELKHEQEADTKAQEAKKKNGGQPVEGELTDEERVAIAKELAAAPAAAQQRKRDLRKELVSGDPQQTLFYCSGLSIWSLAAAGYKLDATIVGTDGTPFYGEVTTDQNKQRATKEMREGPDKQKLKVRKVSATLKGLVDGEPESVAVLTAANGRLTGGDVGELGDLTRYSTNESGELALAARGAAGAFVLANIGKEVGELDQKPGDFAQSRYQTKGGGKDSELAYRGFGHAWQVNEVQVSGHAMFGKNLPGAPRPVTGALEGWHTDVPFLIDDITNPALVGKHTVTKASRLEANIPGAVNQHADTDHNGGVQITGLRSVPDPDAKSPGYVVFYGRLGTSRWHDWKEATPASAQAAISGSAAPAEPALDAIPDPGHGTPAEASVPSDETVA